MSSPVFSAKRTEKGVGISGFLSEEGSVFYTQLFSGSHIGKVSDLLVARLRNEGLEEVSLRLIIVLGLFEASEFALAKENPVSFECGFDHEKMVLGFSFVGNHADKKLSASTLDPFMSHLSKFSDEIIIRHHENKNRTEMIALISKSTGDVLKVHSAKITETSLDTQPELDVKVKNYTELGDLDFDKLLADRFAPEQVADDAFETDVKVSGNKEKSDDTERRFKADSDGEDHTATEVKAKPSVVKKLLQKVFGGSKTEDQIEEKVFKKDRVKSKAPKIKLIEADEAEEIEEEVQVFDKSGVESAAETVLKNKKEAVDHSEQSVKALGELPTEEEILKAESSLQEAFKKIASNVAEVKSELKTEKAKGYVDTLSAELIAEKSRLSELSKKISITVRQKELEFKNKEQAFETELRKKEDLLKQKELAAARFKEQLTKVSADLDEARNSGRSSEDEVRDRTKLAQSQRLLAVAKQENTDLVKKMDEMKEQLMQLQQSKAGTKASAEEIRALKDKADKAVRQVEEIRKTNQQLLDKLSDKNFERTSNQSSAEDLKRKFEASQKAAATLKKDFDKVSHQYEELRREDLRMKMELGKLREELKRAKSQANRASGGGASGPTGGAAGGSTGNSSGGSSSDAA